MTTKVVFCGIEKTGKSKTILDLKGININSYKYKPTIGLEVHSLKHNGTTYSIWDCAGDSKYTGLVEGNFVGTNICVFFSSGNATSDLQLLNRYKQYCNKNTRYLIVDTQKETSNSIINKIHNA